MELFNEYGLAFGWTLIHMTWISLALALCVQLIRIVLKRPSIQYGIGMGAILSLPIISILLFNYLSYSSAAHGFHELGGSEGQLILALSDSSQAITFTGWIDQHMDWIVVLWFAGMVSFVARLLFGFSALARLRSSIEPLSDFWSNKFWKLAVEFQISKRVILGASRLIEGPITFGYFKPVILLPVGMVNALSVEEVEAILRHELSHIARNDFIFKMIQSAVESIFYYTPGTWWLSKMIDVDREQSCDDYALATGTNSEAYVRALYKVNTFNTLDRHLALGFGKEKNQLLNRVKRILKQPQEKINVMGRLVFPIILLLVVAAVSINATWNNPEIEEDRPEEAVASKLDQLNSTPTEDLFNDFNGVRQDTTTKPKAKTKSKSSTKSSVNGSNKSFSISRNDGKITEMKVDGKIIDPKDYDKYLEEYDRSRSNDFKFKYNKGAFSEQQMNDFKRRMEELGDRFENNEEWKAKMKDLERSMEEWGEQFELSEEQQKDLERRWSEWGEKFSESWGEDFGKNMQEWGEKFGDQFANGFSFNFDTEGLERWGEEMEERLELYREKHPEHFYQDEDGEWHLNKDNLTDEEAEEIFGEGWIEDLMSNTMDMMKGFDFNFKFDDMDFEMPEIPAFPIMPYPGAEAYPGADAYPGARPYKLNLKSFKAELAKDGHFKDSGKADIKMDENTLTINGKVQSKSAYKKYAEIIKRDWGEDYLEEYEIDFTIVDKDSKAKKKIKGTYRI